MSSTYIPNPRKHGIHPFSGEVTRHSIPLPERFFREHPDPSESTDCPPGSEGKVQALMARYESGLPLWNGSDAKLEAWKTDLPPVIDAMPLHNGARPWKHLRDAAELNVSGMDDEPDLEDAG